MKQNTKLPKHIRLLDYLIKMLITLLIQFLMRPADYYFGMNKTQYGTKSILN